MDYLEHHGIKGQKWGVRRTPAQLGHKSITKSEVSEEREKSSHSKNVKNMSDTELRESLKRLRMEEEYKKLNPSTISKGKKIVKTAIATATTLSTVATTAITLRNSYKTIRSWFDTKPGINPFSDVG